MERGEESNKIKKRGLVFHFKKKHFLVGERKRKHLQAWWPKKILLKVLLEISVDIEKTERVKNK